MSVRDSMMACMTYEAAEQVSIEEADAGLLGLEWASPQVLTGLQQLCIGLSHAGTRGQGPAVKHLLRSVRVCLHASAWLHARMHYNPKARTGEEVGSEVVSALQHLDNIL